MNAINQRDAETWRHRLKQCMDERGLTQLQFVGQLNRRYLTKYHQKDVSRWLNAGNRAASGTIGFPRYETMAMIADFFGVDVGYLTGETDGKTFAMSDACEYTGLTASSIGAIREWIEGEASNADKADGTGEAGDTGDAGTMRRYRADTINAFVSSPHFAELMAKLMTLHEMSTIWNGTPGRFDDLMRSLADDSNLPVGFTLELIVGAFQGMASESFSRLVRDAYPTPQAGKDLPQAGRDQIDG